MDRLEEEIPLALVTEWNEFLNYELEQYAQALTSMIPSFNYMAKSGNGIKSITNGQNSGWSVR